MDLEDPNRNFTPALPLIIQKAAEKFGIPQEFIAKTIQAESGGDANATSPAGAKGLMQLMDPTAKELGVQDSADPVQNVFGGTKYLNQMMDRYGGDQRMASAAYNAGPGRVDAAGGIPNIPETMNYVNKIHGPQAATVNPVTPTTAAIPAAPQAAEKKNTFTSKILPLLLRFGLPTAAAAAIGSRDPFIGAGPAALAGLASGGIGYLNQNQQNANADKKYAFEGNKLKTEQANKDREYDLNVNNTQNDNTRLANELKRQQDKDSTESGFRNREVSLKEQEAIPGTEKVFMSLRKQLGDRKVDVSNKADRKLFKAAILKFGVEKPKDIEDNAFSIGPLGRSDAVDAWMEQYNQSYTPTATENRGSVTGMIYQSPDGRKFPAKNEQEAAALEARGAKRIQ